MQGEVKWFKPGLGYGFITGKDTKDYFVHQTSLSEGIVLNQGDKVTFKPSRNEKGLQAQEVQKDAQE